MAQILFVCLGNICRSPAAEGILRHRLSNEPSLRHIEVQSCGLGDWHLGRLPDLRIQEAALRRGISLTSRAQPFLLEFFDKFDLILTVDREVLNTLLQHAKTLEHKNKLHLITKFSTQFRDQDIPDPYYAGDGQFDYVLDMIEDACEGLIQYLKTLEDR